MKNIRRKSWGEWFNPKEYRKRQKPVSVGQIMGVDVYSRSIMDEYYKSVQENGLAATHAKFRHAISGLKHIAGKVENNNAFGE